MAVETDTYDPTKQLSHSSLTLHRKCPQAWNYRHLRGLEEVPAGPQIDRELGGWWHALRAADAITRGVEHQSLREVPKRLRTIDGGPEFHRVGPFVPSEHPFYEIAAQEGDGHWEMTPALILATAEAWWKRLGADTIDAWVERVGTSLPAHLEWMDVRWHARWDDDLQHEHPLGVEMKWTLPLPGTEAVMVGYIDEVYLDTRRSIVVVRDAKSKRTLDSQTSADDLLDSQLQIYAWGLRPVVAEWGMKITAVAYDRARSAPAKQPQITQSGSLSKSVTDYDLDTYLTFAQGPDGNGVPWGEPDTYVKSGKRKGEAKWGLYHAEETVIEKLSSPVALSIWHQRTLVPLNKNIVTAHVQAAIDTQKDTERTTERVERTGAAPRNFTKEACRWCEYAGLCRAEMIGGSRGEFDPSDYGLKHRDAEPASV